MCVRKKITMKIEKQDTKELIDDERIEIISILKLYQDKEEETYGRYEDEKLYFVTQGRLDGLQKAINLIRTRLKKL